MMEAKDRAEESVELTVAKRVIAYYEVLLTVLPQEWAAELTRDYQRVLLERLS